MSVNLSALIGCRLSRENLYCLPELLKKISIPYYSSNWHWHECGPPEPIDINNFEHLIDEGFLWIQGPNNMTVTLSRETIEIGYGWCYPHFFTQAPSVDHFMNFCSDIATELDCPKVYFLPDSACENRNYQQIEQLIASGHFTVTDVLNRLSEYCDHNVYSKHITKRH